MVTFEELDALPVGRVLERYVNDFGSHSRLKIVRPTKYNSCEMCGVQNLKKVAKTEMGGNITVGVQCLKCVAIELSNRPALRSHTIN